MTLHIRTRPTAATSPSLTPARQAAAENALTMALHFVRQPACSATLWAATARATRAATLLKQASDGAQPDPVPHALARSCGPLMAILRRIVVETMAYPPQCPESTSSYLPPELVEQAQSALSLYGARVAPSVNGRA